MSLIATGLELGLVKECQELLPVAVRMGQTETEFGKA